MDKKSQSPEVKCPQCSGRGWRFPDFWQRPVLIPKFVSFVVRQLVGGLFGFCGCRACDRKGKVPKEWLEGEE